jgi:hypothetical protein
MAFSSFDFSLLKIENIDIIDGMGMKFIMPCPGWPKDEHFLPFLPENCPVKAMQNWLALSGLKHGPVYRKLDRWGNLGSSALRENSYIVILKEAADRSIEKHITGKSVKYGFVDWALENEWGLIDIQNHIMRHSITKKMLKALRTKKVFNLKHLG